MAARAVAYDGISLRAERDLLECSARLVLFRQHDSNHALGDRRIGWVGRVLAKRLIVVVDLEKYRVAVGVAHTEIMLFVRIVRLAEVVIDGDRLTILATASAPSAATPAVMTAWPVLKSFRKRSLRARMVSVSLVMLTSEMLAVAKRRSSVCGVRHERQRLTM